MLNHEKSKYRERLNAKAQRRGDKTGEMLTTKSTKSTKVIQKMKKKN